jgi:hypothetical protein
LALSACPGFTGAIIAAWGARAVRARSLAAPASVRASRAGGTARDRGAATLKGRDATGGPSGPAHDDRDMSAGHDPEDFRRVALALSGGGAGRWGHPHRGAAAA